MGGGGFLQLGEEIEPSISIMNLLSSSASGKGFLLWGGVQETPEPLRLGGTSSTQPSSKTSHLILFWRERQEYSPFLDSTWPTGSTAVSPPREQPAHGYGIPRMDPSMAIPPPLSRGAAMPSRSCQTLPKFPGRSFQAPSSQRSSLGLSPQLEAEPRPCPWHGYH